jgi:predicted Zn-dependent protease
MINLTSFRGRSALAALVLVGGCATSTTRTLETGVAGVLVSPDQENQIGLQLKTDLDTKQGVVYLTDPAVVEYVRAVANNVITFGRKERPEVTWQVFVIDDSQTVNAFATPGGYLYVYRGLLETAQNEAELAAVMAHETGHVVARHAARSMVVAYGLDAMTALAAGKNPGLAAQLTSSIAGKGVLLAHSRADETEADEYGARYASSATYDPHAFSTFFQRLQQVEGSQPGVLTYLSDHPATGDRIVHINGYIQSQHLTGTVLSPEPYARMRARLKMLPPSPAKGSRPAGSPPGAPPSPPPGAPPSPPPGAPPRV